jgi:hypothetical protein
MSELFDDWYVHSVQVNTLISSDELGAQTFAAHTVTGWFERDTRLVRGPNGEDLSSAAQFYPPSATDPAWFVPGSTVTFDGELWRILEVARMDSTTGDELDGMRVALI